MKKTYILTDNRKFNDVIKTGKKFKNKAFVVYFLPNFELKIGITVGTKLGKAHFRNYQKRVVRSICHRHISKFKEGYYVIICREGIKGLSYEKKESLLLELIERIDNVKEK